MANNYGSAQPEVYKVKVEALIQCLYLIGYSGMTGVYTINPFEPDDLYVV